MSSLKCPRCKKEINENDIFCMSCGMPMKEEIKVKTKENEKEGKIETETYEKTANQPSKDKNNIPNISTKKTRFLVPIVILSIISICLAAALIYFIFFKKEDCPVCEECKEPEIQIIEKEPTFQYINFHGYRFSIPLDWNFEGDTEEYRFTNQDENIYVLISDLSTVSYSTFISDSYQKVYVDTLQTSYDISITTSEKKEKDNISYYIMEGSYNSYNYIIIATENDNGIFLTEAQFEDNSVFTTKKEEVIDFALSYAKNDKI